MEPTFVDLALNNWKEFTFLFLFGYLFWDTRKESKEREGKLIIQLERSSDQLDKSIEALEKLQKNFESLNDKIDQIQNIVKGGR